jgi:acid stress chaperone HdeB
LRLSSDFVYQKGLRKRSGGICRKFVHATASCANGDDDEDHYFIAVCRYPALASTLSSAPAHAVVLDLSTLTCRQFIEGGEDEIKMVLTWMDGWYKGDSDEAIIDTEVFVANAKKFGAYCAKNPTISIVNAAEEILGK